MFSISNNQLTINIHPKGAELQSIFSKVKQQEYMWSGDAKFWSKHSPVLFPIVGTLKHDTYYFEEKPYKLLRHGFARDMNFSITAQTETSITFTLLSDESTLAKFPFKFEFNISYTLTGSKLNVTYNVVNTGEGDMYFSIGGHPAFKLPLNNLAAYNDYYLAFSKNENADRWPINDEGLIKNTPVALLKNTNQLPLTKALFLKDALVFKKLQSGKLKLVSVNDGDIFEFDFTGFPYLGLWAAKGADFICIEPWCGIADSEQTNQQLINKEGINKLNSKQVFERSWSITIL
jgi:galactose mutarotase-like enzyme